MSSVGLAIFVKTPGLSPVKTRLWPRIGQRCAEVFHLASAEAVASVASQAEAQSAMRAYWAVAERPAFDGDHWKTLPKLGQGEGGLGERMREVHKQLLDRHGAAILLGADTPQLDASCLVRASLWLQEAGARAVMGRSEDGGFWLFGSNRLLPERAWTDVVYSAPTTAEKFLSGLDTAIDCLALETLHDVDVYEDIEPVVDALDRLAMPTDAQCRLRTLMRHVLVNDGVCP
ncbi:MAG: DUF2064 domain-containing protein [Ahniella sp.]|nr:DUF2064 domain-containing protein [Ahniella sp.]